MTKKYFSAMPLFPFLCSCFRIFLDIFGPLVFKLPWSLRKQNWSDKWDNFDLLLYVVKSPEPRSIRKIDTLFDNPIFLKQFFSVVQQTTHENVLGIQKCCKLPIYIKQVVCIFTGPTKHDMIISRKSGNRQVISPLTNLANKTRSNKWTKSKSDLLYCASQIVMPVTSTSGGH